MHTKPKALLLVIALFVFAASGAETQAGKNLLWKVQGKSNAVYLLGSIHFLKKEFYPLPQPIEDAYAKSSVVAFETDFAELMSMETQMKLLKEGSLPPGQSIKEHVPGETYAALESYLQKNLGAGKAFDQLKPWRQPQRC